MNESTPSALVSWVSDLLLLGRDKRPHPDRFELWYSSDDGAERLHVIRPAELEDEPEPLPMASELTQVATKHAETLPAGTNLRYAVQCYRDEQDKLPERTHHFVLTGTAQNPLTLGASLSAERGQLIRHNENMHGFMLSVVQTMTGRLARDLEEERVARRQAERRAAEVATLRERMLDRQHERDLELAREAKAGERFDALLTMALTLAPTILARLGAPAAVPVMGAGPANAPAPLPPEASIALARDRALRSIVEQLNGVDVERIASSIRPELLPALLELLSSYREDPPQTEKKAS